LVSEKRNTALVQENLYVVREDSSEKLQRVLPKRFASLVPKLKASDYDYIIFDMPPVSQTSMTSRLAGLMDMTLLVIESEKTDRDAVQQAKALLSLSKTTVGAVLNKTRRYIPARLHRESLGDV
jgi:Mrp family chromosome partitioning ATPase